MTVWPHPGSRSSTGIHSLIASPLCVTQKQTQNVSFLPCFRHQKNRLYGKAECHVFSQKNLTHGFAVCELRMCNGIRFAWFPGGILPVWYLYLHFSTYIPPSGNDLIYGSSSGCGSNATQSAHRSKAISSNLLESRRVKLGPYSPLGTADSRSAHRR
jgi:hypothetical protein